MPDKSFPIILCLILALVVFASLAQALENPGPPEISQANFLLLPDIPQLTLDFSLAWTDSAAGFFVKPYDVIVLHVMVDGNPMDAFVFSDMGMQRLIVWLCTAPDQLGNRCLNVISEYEGDDAGYFDSPSGLATNAISRLFDPDNDVVYVADRGHDRIVELSYTPDKDGGQFRFNRALGEGYLEWPVDVAVSAYLDQTSSNADLYVVQKGYGGKGLLQRFDISGNHELTLSQLFLGTGDIVLWDLANPVAINCYPDTISGYGYIFLTDATDSKLFQLHSNTDTIPEWVMERDLKATSSYWQPGGVAFDGCGRVYIANTSVGIIEIYGPYLNWLYSSIGEQIDWYPMFNYPSNIMIDTYYGFCEMTVLEHYGRQSGIQTILISNGTSLQQSQQGFRGGNLVRPVVKTAAPVPTVFALKDAYPNPFNSYSIIRFSLPKQSSVVLDIYNILGQKVTTLVDEVKEAGEYSALFKGGELSSGVYYVKMRAGDYQETKSIVLVK